jgi:hypothetical protein
MHEARMHKENVFVTLTYDDKHLPEHAALKHKDFADFIKRLREHLARKKDAQISYYMCGEYGERLGRPHYHAALFGVDFADKKYWRTSQSGHHCYRSQALEQIWTAGISEIGELTYASAIYMARYIQKRITGEMAKEHYKRTLTDGTRVTIPPEYNRMSTRPAIGKSWYTKWKKDVYNNKRGTVIHGARKQKPPRYYDKLYQDEEPEAYDELVRARQEALKSPTYRADNTTARRKTREEVHKAYTKLKSRDLINYQAGPGEGPGNRSSEAATRK